MSRDDHENGDDERLVLDFHGTVSRHSFQLVCAGIHVCIFVSIFYIDSKIDINIDINIEYYVSITTVFQLRPFYLFLFQKLKSLNKKQYFFCKWDLVYC